MSGVSRVNAPSRVISTPTRNEIVCKLYWSASSVLPNDKVNAIVELVKMPREYSASSITINICESNGKPVGTFPGITFRNNFAIQEWSTNIEGTYHFKVVFGAVKHTNDVRGGDLKVSKFVIKDGMDAPKPKAPMKWS
jgi:hypothetical protein